MHKLNDIMAITDIITIIITQTEGVVAETALSERLPVVPAVLY